MVDFAAGEQFPPLSSSHMCCHKFKLETIMNHCSY